MYFSSGTGKQTGLWSLLHLRDITCAGLRCALCTVQCAWQCVEKANIVILWTMLICKCLDRCLGNRLTVTVLFHGCILYITSSLYSIQFIDYLPFLLMFQLSSVQNTSDTISGKGIPGANAVKVCPNTLTTTIWLKCISFDMQVLYVQRWRIPRMPV